MACLNSMGLLPSVFLFYAFLYFTPLSFRTFTEKDLKGYRDKVVAMFRHAYDNYLANAFPFDELKPLSCQGMDTWGSFSLTLIDSLDTLAVMRNYSEFKRVVDQLVATADFNININVSVFETNIRVVGGLLSAHLLSHKAGLDVEPGWPCSGPLLHLAESVARRLLPAFNTNTGMPYGTVNLRHGVPPGETPITCTAGVSTFVIEFGTLSRLTGDPIFEQAAQKAIDALWQRRSSLGLVGNHINIQEGKWTAMDAGIGGGIDSYYEYLLKGAILFQDPKLMKMFRAYLNVIERYMRREDWYFWISMGSGQVTMPVFQSLESFWPGLLSLIGKTDDALKTLYNYHQVWKQYGFTPEFYDIPHGHVKREGYPLRPELIESIMYLYRATKDPHLLEIGVDILESIDYSAWTSCGYATIKNVVDHRIEDRMESFFLAETTKYLYLLFDPNNFIHNNGSCGEIVKTTGGDCLLGTGYVFNTEAHPIDISAVYCCSKNRKEQGIFLSDFGESLDFQDLLNIRKKWKKPLPPLREYPMDGNFPKINLLRKPVKSRNKKKNTINNNKNINIINNKNTNTNKNINTNTNKKINIKTNNNNNEPVKIKTVGFETRYSHEDSISDTTDTIRISASAIDNYERMKEQISDLLDLPDPKVWNDEQDSVLGKSFFVNFGKSNFDNHGKGGEAFEPAAKDLLGLNSEHFSYSPFDVVDPKEHYTGIGKINKVVEMISERFERDDNPLHKPFSAVGGIRNIPTTLSEDELPEFDRSTYPESTEPAATSKPPVLNDSTKGPANSKNNLKKPKNFYAGSGTKIIPLIPAARLDDIANLDTTVSSDEPELIASYELLSCPAKSFVSRLNLMGEMVQ